MTAVTITWDEGQYSIDLYEAPESGVHEYGDPLPVEVPDELVVRFLEAERAYRQALRAIVDTYGESKVEQSDEAHARYEEAVARRYREIEREDAQELWRIIHEGPMARVLFTNEAEREAHMATQFGTQWKELLT